jgi:hypothetical protein
MRAPLFGQLILASSMILVSPGGVVSAQTEQQSFSIRVQVSVEAENETLTSKIVSYLNRELRSLGDVVVTDHEPQYKLYIVALEGEFTSGTQTGAIALSTVLTMALKETTGGRMVKQLLEYKGSEWAFVLIEDERLFLHLWVQTGGTKDLRSLCETIVATIDSKYFEAARRDWQTSQDELSKEKQ